MSDSPVDPRFPAELRLQAEFLQKQGHALVSAGHVLSTDALSVLFKLALSSESAADSLKMLHELQTHQIELDLQLEQSVISERETAAELAHYKALYEFAPVGYFSISREGHTMACNLAGAALFGLPCSELDGHLFQHLLAPASRPAFCWQLKKLFNGSGAESCTVQTGASGEMQQLRLKACLAPDGSAVFMTVFGQERPAAA